MSDKDTVFIACTIVETRPKAVYIRDSYDDLEWVPRSVIEAMSKSGIEVQTWWAKERHYT